MELVTGEDLAPASCATAWTFERAARLFIQVCSRARRGAPGGHRAPRPQAREHHRGDRRDGSEHRQGARLRARQAARGPPQRAGISSSGQVLGTPYYMAPEQVRGEAVDARADIYASARSCTAC